MVLLTVMTMVMNHDDDDHQYDADDDDDYDDEVGVADDDDDDFVVFYVSLNGVRCCLVLGQSRQWASLTGLSSEGLQLVLVLEHGRGACSRCLGRLVGNRPLCRCCPVVSLQEDQYKSSSCFEKRHAR